MKRVVVGHYGGPEVLQVVEEDDPRPGPGEVRVRVLAAGVSFSDALLRTGTYLGGPKPPFTPGYELVGVVEELGSGCSRLREGDRVAALTVWGAGSPAKAWTSCSTGSVARCRFAPSVRCGRAEGWSCSATPPRSRRGAGAGERGSSGTRRPRASFSGACSRPAGGSTATGSTSCATATRNGSGRTSSRCSSSFAAARSTPSWPSAYRSPKCAARTSCWRARRRPESSCSCHNQAPHAKFRTRAGEEKL